MSTLKVNNLQVGQDSTATNNLTWFQPGSPDGTIRLGSGNAGSATSKFTFDKDGHLTCVGNITANSIIAPIEGTLDDWIVHDGDTNTKFGFPAADTFSVETAGQQNVQVDGTRVLLKSPSGTNTTVRLQHQGNSGYGDIILDRAVNAFVIDNDPSNASNNQSYFAVKNKGAINFYIKHDGKIGIGTAAPASILHVAGGSSPTILNKPSDASPAYFVGDSNRTGAGQHLAELKGRWNGNDVGRIVFLAGADTSNKDDGHIRFDTTPSGGSSTERLRIKSDGTINITTANGNLEWTASSGSNPFIRSIGSGQQSLEFNTGGNEVLRITSAGHLNIGGVSPSSSALAVKMATNKHVAFSPSQSEVGSVPALVAFQDNGSLNSLGFRGTDLRFATGSSERMRISSSGRLLLNTTDNSGYSNRSAYFTNPNDPWNYISITGGTGGGGGIVFGDGTGQSTANYESYMYHHNGDNHFYLRTDQGNKEFKFTNTGDLELGHGNLKFGTNGKGIDFSANTDDESGAGSISSELLDDYEVGTWVPTYTSSNATFGYSTQEGWYIKVGKLVTVRAYIRTSSVSSSSHSLLKMSGLPFQVAKRTPCSVRAWGFQGSGYDQFPTVATFEHNQTFLEFLKYSSGGTSDYTTSTMNNDTSVVICGSYKVD